MKIMRLIIDRFEGNFAVCEQEDKTMINLGRDSLPPAAKVGDVLTFEDGIYKLDEITTQVRKDRIEKLIDDLWK